MHKVFICFHSLLTYSLIHRPSSVSCRAPCVVHTVIWILTSYPVDWGFHHGESNYFFSFWRKWTVFKAILLFFSVSTMLTDEAYLTPYLFVTFFFQACVLLSLSDPSWNLAYLCCHKCFLCTELCYFPTSSSTAELSDKMSVCCVGWEGCLLSFSVRKNIFVSSIWLSYSYFAFLAHVFTKV